MRPCLRPRHVYGNQACAGRGLSKGGAYNTTCRPTGVSTHFKLHFAQLSCFQGASSAYNYLAAERHHTSKSAHVSTCAFASIRLSSLDNLTSAYQPRCRAVYRTMPCVDRHALQSQAIQVFADMTGARHRFRSGRLRPTRTTRSKPGSARRKMSGAKYAPGDRITAPTDYIMVRLISRPRGRTSERKLPAFLRYDRQTERRVS